ncbi:14205_t:CDS:2 [Dentiscutata heterogama]|uniref:14205_t:CDS:1 n=2 Tax=Dentiscutata heterogama TaxID=1316150 RepID=A0ACA9K6X3_9GLOM|nr:14202_t:CDS:2 [Dentiscutata heterogama]CAG8456631.1 14205_t:CDS:2 [Dentiscutata heterogama]
MNLVCPKSVSIIIVLLAIIVPLSHSEIPFINSIIEYLQPWADVPLSIPVDEPIFRDLANTTIIFLKIISTVNIPPSAQIIDQRPTGLFIANVADKVGRASQTENQMIVQYLKDLAESAYQTGKKAERLFSTGEYLIGRIGNEITSIRETLVLDTILSRRNITFLSNRINKLLFQITEFRDQFKAILVAIDEEEKIWNGTNYGINSFPDIETYFELIKPTGRKIYKWENILNSLTIFKRGFLVTFEARREVESALRIAELVRIELIQSKEIIRGLNKRKIVSRGDLMNLEGVEKLAEVVSASWAEKDKSKIIVH